MIQIFLIQDGREIFTTFSTQVPVVGEWVTFPLANIAGSNTATVEVISRYWVYQPGYKIHCIVTIK